PMTRCSICRPKTAITSLNRRVDRANRNRRAPNPFEAAPPLFTTRSISSGCAQSATQRRQVLSRHPIRLSTLSAESYGGSDFGGYRALTGPWGGLVLCISVVPFLRHVARGASAALVQTLSISPSQE